MTDTPILDSFLPALTRSIRSAPPLDDFRSGPIKRPINAFEVEGDTINLMTGESDDTAHASVPSLWIADRNGLLARADVLPASVCFLLAFRAETTWHVAAFHNNGKGLIGIDPYSKFVNDTEWIGWGSMFAAHHNPSIDGYPLVFDDYPHLRARVRDDEPSLIIGQLVVWHAMCVLNEYLDRLAEHETNPVYRMSTSGAHKLYNKARPKKAGIVIGTVRVLDLSRPRVTSIPIGPSAQTGIAKRPHWRREHTRIFTSPRFKNMQGKKIQVKESRIHDGTPPTVVKTIIRGLV